MTLQQLEYVIALDTYRHFVKAAENCFVTQPTITIQVKNDIDYYSDVLGLDDAENGKSLKFNIEKQVD